jgi:hypothetical protein
LEHTHVAHPRRTPTSLVAVQRYLNPTVYFWCRPLFIAALRLTTSEHAQSPHIPRRQRPTFTKPLTLTPNPTRYQLKGKDGEKYSASNTHSKMPSWCGKLVRKMSCFGRAEGYEKLPTVADSNEKASPKAKTTDMSWR